MLPQLSSLYESQTKALIRGVGKVCLHSKPTSVLALAELAALHDNRVRICRVAKDRL